MIAKWRWRSEQSQATRRENDERPRDGWEYSRLLLLGFTSQPTIVLKPYIATV